MIEKQGGFHQLNHLLLLPIADSRFPKTQIYCTSRLMRIAIYCCPRQEVGTGAAEHPSSIHPTPKGRYARWLPVYTVKILIANCILIDT